MRNVLLLVVLISAVGCGQSGLLEDGGVDELFLPDAGGAGLPDDGGLSPFDGGEALDAGSTSDAGAKDGGPADAGLSPDGGEDGGTADAGANSDAGQDGGSGDAGLPLDAGPWVPTVLVGGDDHTCVTFDGGVTRCWGDNVSGQLGNGGPDSCTFQNTSCARTPVTVNSALPSVVELAAGSEFSCALSSDGKVRCWGTNNAGQLGLGVPLTTSMSLTAKEISGLPSVIHVASGGEHACALQSDRQVRCWGNNAAGQLGATTFTSCERSNGTRFQCSRDPVLVAGLGGVRQLALGSSHTCALLLNGQVWCWGNNAYDQLADSSAGSRRVNPGLVQGIQNAAQLSSGALHTCALLADGTARCWGLNTYGQLGDGTTTRRAVPTLVPSLTGLEQLSGGGYHTCARRADGTTWCWGLNADGQCGVSVTTTCVGGGGTAYKCARSPVQAGGLSGAIQLALSAHHSCALLPGGVSCWGSHYRGQLGRGSTAYSWSETPLPVLNLP